MTEYYGILDCGTLEYLGEYACWDDLEYDKGVESYCFIYTRESLACLISNAALMLGGSHAD